MAGTLRALVAALALGACCVLGAQRLPIRAFSAADGLPGGGIGRIVRDARGFLWFCGAEGTARFDGHTFARFGTEAGLPSPVTRDLLQTQDGCYWFATDKGLCRLDPSRAARGREGDRVQVLPLPPGGAATRLLEDRRGVLWCGTTLGLLRVDRTPGREALQAVDLGMPRRLWDDPIVSDLAEREGGGLWVAAGSGLYALDPGGRVLRFTQADGLPDTLVRALASGVDGVLWVGTRNGLARLRLPQGATRLEQVERFSEASGLASADVLTVVATGDGRILAGTARGLSILDGETIRNHGAEQGVNCPVFALAETASGEIWLGGDRGAQRWVRDGLTTYAQAEGLVDPRVDLILEDRHGTLVAVVAQSGTLLLQGLQGSRFGRAALPPGPYTPGWGWNQRLLQDHLGGWWMAAAQGLCRFGRAATAAEVPRAGHLRTYGVSAATGADGVFALFEDSRGDIWFSVASPVTNGLGRWRRAQDRVEGFRDQEGLPRLFNSLPTAFAEDRAGHVWVAFNGAGLVRYRQGRFERFGREQGVPEGWIRSLLVDSAGRLWVASAMGGAGIVEDPAAERPRIRALTTAQGLASNSVWSLAEDLWGRFYIGTGAGIDRVDLEHGRVLHLSEAQGLAPGIPRAAHRDREGAIWFGLNGGLSRYLPPAPRAAPAPPIYMTGLRVAGVPRTLGEAGIQDLDLPDLAPQQNRIQVDFSSPGGPGGGEVLYQYRLEGLSGDWTPPGPLRTVDFANLARGRYHFQVRAVGAGGTASDPPAELRFTVLAPVWMRGWFLLLASAAAGGLAWLAYRTRLRRLLEVERIRTRIAADLHDDIGASLSRIAILSEVVKLRTPGDQPETGRFLSEIAESSRELVDSMAEIVWSIDPKRDDLKHLLARVGQFASGALDARGIRWTMSLPEDPGRIKLTPEQRRGVFLILKEAINNALKHSGCRAIHLAVEAGHGRVAAQVRDDGTGLPPEAAGGDSSSSRRGRGLANMHARAQEMGGRLQLATGPGGTTVRLELPHRGLRGA